MILFQMETYYFSRKKKAANKISSMTRTKQNWLMLASNATIYGKEKPTFINIQNPSELLHKLGIWTTSDILF